MVQKNGNCVRTLTADEYFILSRGVSIVFLDIRCVAALRLFGAVIPQRMERLQNIILATKADLVILSNWGEHFSDEDEVKAAFGEYGLSPVVLGWAGPIRRGGDVRDYLREAVIPRKFIILCCSDDYDEFLPLVLKSEPHYGLRGYDVERSIQLLIDQEHK